jgi:hypothetical protein
VRGLALDVRHLEALPVALVIRLRNVKCDAWVLPDIYTGPSNLVRVRSDFVLLLQRSDGVELVRYIWLLLSIERHGPSLLTKCKLVISGSDRQVPRFSVQFRHRSSV